MSDIPSSSPDKKNPILQVIGFLTVVVLIVGGASVASRIVTTNKGDIQKIAEEKVKEIIKEKRIVVQQPACENTVDEFQSLKQKGQSLQLTTGQLTHGENGRFVGLKSVTVSITGKDEISCGYIYVKASKGGKSLEDKYDSVYIDPQDFGGHLLRTKGILNTNAQNFTEFLLPLSAVSFLPNLPYDPNAQNFRIANWATMLNVNSHVYFDIALSTVSKGGLIEDVTIAYKCWDPQTGDESNDCQLSIGR